MTDIDPSLAGALARYLGQMDQERANYVATTLAALSERELQLVREAAVMGYVRGTIAGREHVIPRDLTIVAEVIACCRSMGDLYPLLGHGGQLPPEEETDHDD